MSLVLRLIALLCFALAVVSAFSTSVNVNEVGFVALGLACWVAATLVVDGPWTR